MSHPSKGCYVVDRLYSFNSDEDGKTYQDRVVSYSRDGHGNLTGSETVSSRGTDAGMTRGKTTYVNDERGNILRQESVSFSELGETRITYDWQYTYDSNGLPSAAVAQIRADDDANSSTVEESRSYSDSKLASIAWKRGSCAYDSLGLIVNRVYEFDSGGSTHRLEYTPEYIFDEFGLPTTAIFTGDNGLEIRLGLEHNSDGMVSAVYLIDSNDADTASSGRTLLYELEYTWIDDPSPAVVANWSIWPRGITTYDPAYVINDILIHEDVQSITGLPYETVLSEQQTITNPVPAANGGLKDGVYTGAGQGKSGTIKVTLSISNGVITVDSITDPGETRGIGGAEAISDGSFANQIESCQSATIDGVTGATLTSNGVRQAVEDALAQALNS